MPDFPDIGARSEPAGPTTLWEAMGAINRVQEEEQLAIMRGDIVRLEQLLTAQTQAWTYLTGFAADLIERHKAPEDLLERLVAVVEVHKQNETMLREVAGQTCIKLREAQEGAAAPQVNLKRAA